jgi:hypothetical protein
VEKRGVLGLVVERRGHMEVELLQETLFLNFHLNSTIHKQGGGFILHIGAKNSQAEKFCDMIKPFVASTMPTMLYKFF